MIKYIGSKRKLLPQIIAGISAFEDVRSVADLFSGTSRVGHALKRSGKFVVANDHLSYAATLARCYVAADRKKLLPKVEKLLAELSKVPAKPGYFTKTFCERARYIQPKNGARVDAIRDEIKKLELTPDLEAVALTSLMEAADRVDSTTGVQMAYLKQWARRAHNDLSLRVPDMLDGKGEAHQLDAEVAAAQFDVDLAYLDPPYNQHSYMGNYHIWETLVRWDEPEAYGIANKRIQCREYSSDFNSKRRIREALSRLVHAVKAKRLVVSFSNEGHVDRAEMEALLAERGHVRTVAVDFKRYVGAQIGIHNPKGEKVGEVSHLRNKEYLFFVGKDAAELEQAANAVCEVGGELCS